MKFVDAWKYIAEMTALLLPKKYLVDRIRRIIDLLQQNWARRVKLTIKYNSRVELMGGYSLLPVLEMHNIFPNYDIRSYDLSLHSLCGRLNG